MTTLSRTRRLALAAVTLAATALVAPPALAATTPADPPLPAGFLEAPAVGPVTTYVGAPRTIVLSYRGEVPGRPGNFHESLLDLYGGPGSSWTGALQDRHYQCADATTDPAAGDCPMVAYAMGFGTDLPVQLAADGKLSLKTTITYSSARGDAWGSRPLPAPAAVDVSATATGWSSVPTLTRANADDVARQRGVTTDELQWGRDFSAEDAGVATGTLGFNNGSAGNFVRWGRNQGASASAGQPLGQIRTAAQIKPFLPALTRSGQVAGRQNASVDTAVDGVVKGAITTSTGKRLPGTTHTFHLGVTVSATATGPRTVTGTAYVEEGPQASLGSLVEAIAADGTLVVAGRVLFTDDAGKSLGWTPVAFAVRKGGSTADGSGQYGSRNRDGADVVEHYSTTLEWTAPTVTASVGGRALTAAAGSPRLTYRRG